MKDIINKITFILTELNFSYQTLKSSKETVVLFYNSIDSESIIFGISIDIYSVDMGTLCLQGESIILGCTHKLSVDSNLKTMISKNIDQIKDSIEKSEQIVYFDEKMKIKQKFLNVNATIENFAQKNNYTLF